jgi:hypothetical protein
MIHNDKKVVQALTLRLIARFIKGLSARTFTFIHPVSFTLAAGAQTFAAGLMVLFRGSGWVTAGYGLQRHAAGDGSDYDRIQTTACLSHAQSHPILDTSFTTFNFL